jgi:hypothetical protein
MPEQGLRRFHHPASLQLACAERTQCRSYERAALGVGRRRWPLVRLWKDHHATVSRVHSRAIEFV